MEANRVRLGLLAIMVLYGGYSLWTRFGPPQDSRQVIDRSRAAYRHLESYQGITTTFAQVGRRTFGYRAHVTYRAPSDLYVKATDASSGHTFEILVNEEGTWKRWFASGNRWERAESPEVAITEFTGVSGSAATTVPALLMKTKSGDPFEGIRNVVPEICQEALGACPFYRVEADTASGHVTYWFDQENYMLVRISHNGEDSSFPFQASGGRTADVTTSRVENFIGVRVNKPLRENAFPVIQDANP